MSSFYRPSLVVVAIGFGLWVGMWTDGARAQFEVPVLIQPRWEYKVLNRNLLLAPVVRDLTRGEPHAQLTPEAQTELTRRLEGMLNEHGAQGWELILDSEQHMIFRRRIG